MGDSDPTPNEVPDWTGLWVWNSNRGFLFDPDTPQGVVTTAKLTPEYQRKLDEEIARINKGIEYDPISSCAPPGIRAGWRFPSFASSSSLLTRHGCRARR